ncbi:MAG: chemotaxis response regulator protein-glutamate methylesterase [Oscillospiraceae bacterium]|jgi:two-component system chemotaxis response regulator CheB|nr:chemotaxis response regulator protein-glutamate methylesterase [Oscillospiraceae bacterium]
MDRPVRTIRVFLVEDSITLRTALVQQIARDPALSMVGESSHPQEGQGRLLLLKPDVLVVESALFLPGGAGPLRALLQKQPMPVIAMGAEAWHESEMLRAGALCFLRKPRLAAAEDLNRFCGDVIQKIKIADHSTVARRRRTMAGDGVGYEWGSVGGRPFGGLVALGASTGGTQSTAQILRQLPADFPGMVIVQHMPPDFTRMYAESMDRECRMRVREARDGDEVRQGLVLIAPGDLQTRVKAQAGGGYLVQCAPGEKVSGHRPSVDVLFSSVAASAGAHAVGVILTGMGADGARGLLEMRRQGAYTLGQDEHSSVVYGMPREAFVMGAVVRQAGLEQIARLLMDYVKTHHRG